MTSDITSPSRRTIVKGAAWAAPALAVAVASPSLAATEPASKSSQFSVEVVCPPTELNLLEKATPSLYFEVTNTGTTVVPAGQEFTLHTTGLANVSVEGLNDIQVDAVLFKDDTTTGTITKALAPGETVEIHVFPLAQLDVNVAVVGETTLTIGGQPTTQKYTLVEVDLFEDLNLTIAFCGEPDVLQGLLGSLGIDLGDIGKSADQAVGGLLGKLFGLL